MPYQYPIDNELYNPILYENQYYPYEYEEAMR